MLINQKVQRCMRGVLEKSFGNNQTEMAKGTGILQNTISKQIRAEKPMGCNLHNQLLLAKYLGLTLAELLTVDEIIEPEDY